MDNNILWTCTYCNIVPSTQSSRKCPRCGRKLTPWDPSKAPLERQPEWPSTKNGAGASAEKDRNHTDYTKFFDKGNAGK